MAPAVESTIDAQGPLDLLVDGCLPLVEGLPNIVQARRGESDHAVLPQGPVGRNQKRHDVARGQMLEEMLGVDRFHVLEVEVPGDVEHQFDSR